MSKLQGWLWGGFSSASNLIFDWELNLQPSTAQFTTPPHNNTLLLICGVGHQHVDIINGKPDQTTTKCDAKNIFLRNQESQVPWKLKVSSTAFLLQSLKMHQCLFLQRTRECFLCNCPRVQCSMVEISKEAHHRVDWIAQGNAKTFLREQTPLLENKTKTSSSHPLCCSLDINITH